MNADHVLDINCTAINVFVTDVDIKHDGVILYRYICCKFKLH